MKKSSKNENAMNNNDEIYLNVVVMEKERMEEEFEIQPSLQIIEKNIYANQGKEKMKDNLKKLLLQRKN
jgi:hypothetical protein